MVKGRKEEMSELADNLLLDRLRKIEGALGALQEQSEKLTGAVAHTQQEMGKLKAVVEDKDDGKPVGKK